jgi:hypothetical protein
MFGSDQATSWTDTNAVGQTQKFYRVVRANPDDLNNGIPYWWAVENGLDPLDPNMAWEDPDGDGYDNWEEYEAGTNPQNPNSHPNSMVTIPNAWAVYSSSNSVQITADVRSTNASVNVKAAEYFMNAVNGTNGAGIAMSATNGAFNSTNEVAVASFSPGFPYGQRALFYLHAEDSNGQWTPFKQVVLNPNVSDILNKVQANYNLIADVTYTTTNSYYVNGVLQQSPVVFEIQQKGAYMTRQTALATGYSVVLNYSQTASFDNNGNYLSGYDISTLTNQMAGQVDTNGAPYYWDVPGFLGGFPEATNSTVSSPSSGTVTFQTTPAQTNLYAPVTIMSDMMHGVPVQETYQGPNGMVIQIQHATPVEVASGVWLPTSESFTTTFTTGFSIEWQQTLGSVQLNTGLSNSLFTIPTVPQQ